MSQKINYVDLKILTALTEYRLLTIPQMERMEIAMGRTLYRRVKHLCDCGFITTTRQQFSSKKGRNERIYSLLPDGIQCLRTQELIPDSIPAAKLMWKKERIMEHQLGVNWVLIHTHLIEKHTSLRIKTLTNTSPFFQRGLHQDATIITHPAGTIQQEEGFFPDAVLVILQPQRSKQLLFFLEYDRGTEALLSNQSPRNDIGWKIQNYQEYFRNEGYQKYNEIFDCSFTGFRVLFVCERFDRQEVICRLVQEYAPSEFIWITTVEAILLRGMGADIWARGGSQMDEPYSILGPKQQFDVTKIVDH